MKTLSAAILILISSQIFGQQQPAFDFLKIDPSARSSALAGAFDTYTDDPNLMFYNPAGISTISANKVSATFGSYLVDIKFGAAAYAMKYKDIGWFGAGVKYFNYGEMEQTNENGVPNGTFGANDIMLSLTYSNLIYDRINWGINAKYIYSKIAEYNSSAIAMDIGFMYLMPSEMMNIAFSVNNLGQQLDAYADSKEKLPLDVRIAVSKQLEHLPLKATLAFANLTEERDEIIQHLRSFSIGAELSFSENVAARFGYNNERRQDLELGSSLGIAGFSGGLGIKVADKYQIDYALNSFGKIGSTHRISLGYIFK